jgi:hypothetical protein
MLCSYKNFVILNSGNLDFVKFLSIFKKILHANRQKNKTYSFLFNDDKHHYSCTWQCIYSYDQDYKEKIMLIKGRLKGKYKQPITFTAPKITTTTEIVLTFTWSSKKSYIIIMLLYNIYMLLLSKSARFMSLAALLKNS